jgi:hypothetical protein
VQGDTVISVNKRFLHLNDSTKKIIYMIRCDRPLLYGHARRSRIGYIGRTDRPGERPFESLRKHAAELLKMHGVRQIELVYVEGTPIQHINISDKLERAFLHEFRERFVTLPKANRAGNRRLELTDEANYVSLTRVKAIILELS